MMQTAEYLMLPPHFWLQGTEVMLQYTCIYHTEEAWNAER